MNVISVRKQASVGRKLDQIRAGAKRIFLRDGFVSANVDEIAKTAGVSKATLYAYFPEKELMFNDSMLSIFDTITDGPLPAEMKLSASAALPSIAVAISDWLHQPLQMKLFRLAVAEAERFPEFTTAYWRYIDTKITEPLHQWLDIQVSQGDLDIVDTALAAQNLIAICETYRHHPPKSRQKQTQNQLRRNAAENAAWIFLKAYETPKENVRFVTQS